MDVTPTLIVKRLQESGGSRYSSSAAAPTPSAPAPKAAPSFRPSQGLGGSQGKVRYTYVQQLMDSPLLSRPLHQASIVLVRQRHPLQSRKRQYANLRHLHLLLSPQLRVLLHSNLLQNQYLLLLLRLLRKCKTTMIVSHP